MSFDYEALGKMIFRLEMPPFDAYLETISDFLKAETKKHHDEITDLREQIRQGKITPDNESDEQPWEYQYEEHIDYLLGQIQEYENILLKSFFVTIYGFLESQLMQRCRKFKDNSDIKLTVSDLRGETLDRARMYLTKVHHINFSFERSIQWNKIQYYGPLRNCIVHNEGRLEGLDEKQRNKIQDLSQKHSGLHISGNEIVLTKEFCKNAWKTIEEFLWLLSQAENQGIE